MSVCILYANKNTLAILYYCDSLLQMHSPSEVQFRNLKGDLLITNVF